MADNVTLNQNTTSGKVVSADDVSGVMYQRIKLDIGADGAASGTAGTAGTPLRVDPTGSTTQPVSAASLPLPSGAATDTKQDTMITALQAIQTALELIDNMISGSEAQVDVVSSALPSGASTSAKQDTIIGHVDGIESLLTTVAGSVAGTEVQVDVLTMPTVTVTDGSGSLTVDGTVAATQSGTWTVQPGNTANTTAWKVDASSVAVPVTDNSGSLTVDNAALSVTGGGVEASALRVTLANDSTGVLSVDDNGSSLTVDGTVAATQSGTWNIATVTTLTSITNAVAVTDNGGNLSIDDGGNSITVDNAGTFAVQATVAAGATTIAKAEDVASADADVGVPAMAVRKGTPANTSGTDGDYEMLQMSAGRLWTSTVVDTALPAGSNAIGKLAANSGVDIGDVDVTSVTLPTGGTPTSGATSITTTASIQVHAGTACKAVILQNDPDNTYDMLIGTSGAESIQLVPGQSVTLAVSNVNLLYAKNVTSSTQTLGWLSIV